MSDIPSEGEQTQEQSVATGTQEIHNILRDIADVDLGSVAEQVNKITETDLFGRLSEVRAVNEAKKKSPRERVKSTIQRIQEIFSRSSRDAQKRMMQNLSAEDRKALSILNIPLDADESQRKSDKIINDSGFQSRLESIRARNEASKLAALKLNPART